MTIKMWACLPLKVERFDRMEAIFFANAGTETENFVELSEVIFIKFITLLIVFIQLSKIQNTEINFHEVVLLYL